jgi:lysozyme family protein
MSPQFVAAFKYLLGDEGVKYTNDPKDSGGPTKYGITKKTFEAFVKAEVDDSRIENMTEDDAMAIYWADYWEPLKLSQVENDGIATALFDCALLYSPKATVLMAQRTLAGCGRAVSADGLVGEKTLHYLNDISPFLFMTVFRGLVVQKISTIIERNPGNEKFRAGWMARANRLLALVPKTNKESPV